MQTNTNPIKVILVHGEASALHGMAALLDDRFEVTTAGDAAQAQEQSRARPFDLICAAQRLPDMTGVELIEALRQRGCTMGALLLVDMHDDSIARRIIRAPDGSIVRLLLEPFRPETLRSTILRLAVMVNMRRAIGSVRAAVEPSALIHLSELQASFQESRRGLADGGSHDR